MKYINELREGNRISGIYLCKHKPVSYTHLTLPTIA